MVDYKDFTVDRKCSTVDYKGFIVNCKSFAVDCKDFTVDRESSILDCKDFISCFIVCRGGNAALLFIWGITFIGKIFYEKLL
jgi:hypothetical protein